MVGNYFPDKENIEIYKISNLGHETQARGIIAYLVIHQDSIRTNDNITLFSEYFNSKLRKYIPDTSNIQRQILQITLEDEFIQKHIDSEVEWFNEIDKNIEFIDFLGNENYKYFANLYRKYLEYLAIKVPTEFYGFDCSLSKPVVTEIYHLMIENKYLQCEIVDFYRTFNKLTGKQTDAIIWLICATRGINAGNGDKRSLREFIETMIGKINAANLRKVPFIFKDIHGQKMILSNSKDQSNIDFKVLLEMAKEKAEQK